LRLARRGTFDAACTELFQKKSQKRINYTARQHRAIPHTAAAATTIAAQSEAMAVPPTRYASSLCASSGAFRRTVAKARS
jgi:hypothetical protein